MHQNCCNVQAFALQHLQFHYTAMAFLKQEQRSWLSDRHIVFRLKLYICL